MTLNVLQGNNIKAHYGDVVWRLKVFVHHHFQVVTFWPRVTLLEVVELYWRLWNNGKKRNGELQS